MAVLEAVDASGRGLRVAFWRTGQRWAHRIALLTDTGVQWILASVEGDSQQAFPPSPPLQQIATQSLQGGRPVVLLLGMAGRSHWSVSAESHPRDRRLRFDVACRAQVADRACLHSVYQVLGSWQLSADANLAEWRGPGCDWRCVTGPDADCPTILRFEPDHLVIGPARLGDSSTHRWRYELTLSQRPPTPR